jgi:hypothetical protein
VAVNQISQDLDWHALKLWQRDRSRKEEDRPLVNSRAADSIRFFRGKKIRRDCGGASLSLNSNWMEKRGKGGRASVSYVIEVSDALTCRGASSSQKACLRCFAAGHPLRRNE